MPFYVVSFFFNEMISFIKYVVKCEWKIGKMMEIKYTILHCVWDYVSATANITVPVTLRQKVTDPTVPIPQHCFDYQKWEKFTAEKFDLFLIQKFSYPLASTKDVQATEKPTALQLSHILLGGVVLVQCCGSMTKFFFLLLFEGTFTSFFKDKKSKKKSQNSRNQGFSYYFCLMIEGTGSGSVPLTNGSGSRRSINIWILQIRVRNTGFYHFKNFSKQIYFSKLHSFYLVFSLFSAGEVEVCQGARWWAGHGLRAACLHGGLLCELRRLWPQGTGPQVPLPQVTKKLFLAVACMFP